MGRAQPCMFDLRGVQLVWLELCTLCTAERCRCFSPRCGDKSDGLQLAIAVAELKRWTDARVQHCHAGRDQGHYGSPDEARGPAGFEGRADSSSAQSFFTPETAQGGPSSVSLPPLRPAAPNPHPPPPHPPDMAFSPRHQPSRRWNRRWQKGHAFYIADLLVCVIQNGNDDPVTCSVT